MGVDPTDLCWAAVFEAVGRRVRQAVLPLFGTEAGRRELGVGAGGDRTVGLDRAAEEAALEELGGAAETGLAFSVISEEAGRIWFGADHPLVLLDPVDGSLNAKRGLPVAAVMCSLAAGPRVRDLRVGAVTDLVSGDHWSAVRGGGLRRNGRLLAPPPAPSRVGVLGLEGSPRNLVRVLPLLEQAGKVRVFGSVALTLCQAAAGAMDLVCGANRSRLFDATAGVLMLQEAGGVVTDLEGHELDARPIDLESHGTLLGSLHPGLHRLALEVLQAH
jgi:myo-inositol-1(or 4)-monophosphatase